MPRQVELLYGRGKLRVELPNSAHVTIIRKPDMPVIRNEAEAVASAFDDPVESKLLAELAQTASSACIAICDITRPVPNRLFLRPLIEELLDGAAKDFSEAVQGKEGTEGTMAFVQKRPAGWVTGEWTPV